ERDVRAVGCGGKGPIRVSTASNLREDLTYDAGMCDAREAFFQAVAIDVQRLVIEPEQVEDCGVPVLDADAILYGGKAELVGLTEHETLLYAAAGQPGDDGILVVVATCFARVLVPRQLGNRQSAHLPTPEHQ